MKALKSLLSAALISLAFSGMLLASTLALGAIQ